MDLEDSDESELDLVDMANLILATLNPPKQITEEELYSDEFYILIFSILFSEEEEEIKIDPGKTQKEKIENLKLILSNLAQIIQGELPDIDPKKIIMKKDKENAKKLVEIFFAMIQMIIQEKIKEEEEIDENKKSFINRDNLSEKKETEKNLRNKDNEKKKEKHSEKKGRK